MSACLFQVKTRVAFRSDPSIRGVVYDWFDGNRDIPAGRNLYSIQWDKVNGQYWYYDSELMLETEAPKIEQPKAKTETKNKPEQKNSEPTIQVSLGGTNVYTSGLISYLDFIYGTKQ